MNFTHAIARGVDVAGHSRSSRVLYRFIMPPSLALRVLGMGNPLLDIAVVDVDGELLRKYGLKLNDAVLGE